MMSLQDLAIEKHLADPLIQNALFDVRARIRDLGSELQKETEQLNELWHGTKFRLALPDMTTYNAIRGELEEALFDQFLIPRTAAHVQWHEYLHGLYDLVSIARTDRTTILILLQTTLQYYDVLERPPDLEPGDKLYPIVATVVDLFRKLRAEHERIAPRDTVEHYRTHVQHHVKVRIEYLAAEQALKEKVALRDRYRRILTG
jgi:hypothetical protein